MDSGRGRSTWGSRGRSSWSGVRTQPRRVWVDPGRQSTNDASDCKDGTPPNRQEAPKQSLPGGISKHSEHELTSGHGYKQDWRSSGNIGLSHMGRNQHGQNPRNTAGSSSQPSGCSSALDSAHENELPRSSDLSHKGNAKPLRDESQIKYGGVTIMPSQNKGPQFQKSSLNNTIGTGKIEHSDHPGLVEPFNNCSVTTLTPGVLKPSLHSKNREMGKGRKQAEDGQKGEVLKPRMVLLKCDISLSVQVEYGRHSTNDASDCKDGTPPNSREAPKQSSLGGISKQSERELTSGHGYKQDWRSSGNKGLSHMGRNQHGQNPRNTSGSSSHPSGCSSASDSVHENYLPRLSDLSHKGNTKPLLNESQIQTPSKYGGVTNMPSQNKGPLYGKSSFKNPIGTGKMEHSDHPGLLEPFNICSVKSGTPAVLRPSLLSKNREIQKERKRAEEGQKVVLKPGMVLLKSYISLSDQVKIIKKCQELGLGSGGFYQPGYRYEAKRNLKMMCLGKNWDPETRKYGDERPVDNAKPPPVPDEFSQLVEEAIKESHAFLAKEKITESSKVEEIIPWMIPDFCIVNFYLTTGRLGLHQDRDESQESLFKGLPVVSFSIGDSAEFLYSDQRDVANAEIVKLESGDVLIFGGKSRHIFHGVGSILPNTSPKILLEETGLRPGRLNLTFRQF